MKKVSICFSRLTDVNFKKKGEDISAALTNNPAYTNLVPALPELDASNAKFSAAMAAAATFDRVAVAEKNKCREELNAILLQLGLSVMTQANGDEATLVSSGFTLVKTREPRHIVNPGNVTLSNGVTGGTMISNVKAVAGGMSYVHEITSTLPAATTSWVSNTTSKSAYVFNNLTPGKQYWVRVAVIGARGQLAYSNVASKFAQ